MKGAFLFFFSVLVFYAEAQRFVEVNAKVYQPIGELSENISQRAMGCNFGYAKQVSERFTVGGDFGVAMYSSDSFSAQTEEGVIDVHEEDCFFTAHVNTRYFPIQSKAIKPYAEARIGLTTFFSTQEVSEETPEFRNSFNWHGASFNSALGAGFITDFRQLIKGEESTVLLNIGANYHTGSRASYRNMMEIEGQAPQAGTFKSLTDYIDLKVGVSIKI